MPVYDYSADPKLPTLENRADLLTKTLTGGLFAHYVSALMHAL
jgi:hypothetical protein